MTQNPPKLPSPARYFPIESGTYEIVPGLKSLSTSFGNGARDSHMFQFDTEFERYRQNKLEARRERLAKYFVTHELTAEVERAANGLIVERLTTDSPDLFRLESLPGGARTLHCALTGEALRFDRSYGFLEATAPNVNPPYSCGFDALACQVQEDLAIISTSASANTASKSASTKDWVSALHLCSPSHWAAESKIGKPFKEVHEPIPGIEKINRAASQFVSSMINKGPYVRFVWGFGSDKRLNHHPEPAPGADPVEWKGRSFDPMASSPFTLRLERQVLFGMPDAHAALFAIRVYFIDGNDIKAVPERRALLRSALLSMTDESRVYKGLKDSMDQVIRWLDSTH